jgi:pyruvate,water dikinase
MGLALLDVADAVRPHPDVLAFLERVEAEGFDDDRFVDALAALPGGDDVRDALVAFLERYGMRCVGEIDVTRPRWAEHPTALVPAILTNVRTFAPGEAERRFERGRREALAKRDSVLARLRELPDGERKAQEAARMIDRVRTFAGYREHPKYAMVCRYFVYKQAIMAQADRLVEAGVLAQRDDVLFLRLEELAEALRDGRVDAELLRSRQAAFREHEALTPPRVLTSEGEMVVGAYRRDGLPDGALPGLGVSAGTVEGRARVAFDIGSAELEPGDILVTPFTDPSWTPVFVAAGGLVTEVGGLMTHGAVVAREYGLPAVVGVQEATRLIADGQRIRVHGTDGYVELLT